MKFGTFCEVKKVFGFIKIITNGFLKLKILFKKWFKEKYRKMEEELFCKTF